MTDYCAVQIIGAVTADPEVKVLENGDHVCTIIVAVNRKWKNPSGELQEKCEFTSVVAWRHMAEIVGQYIKKGSRVFVRGHLETRSWDGPDGTKRYRTQVVSEQIIFLDRPSMPGGSFAQAAAGDDLQLPDFDAA